MDKDDFNQLSFEKKLAGLKDTQDAIQGMSTWCLKQRTHHKKIVSSWLNVLKRVKVEQRLVLFYLANDVIQYSKRKGYDYVESWGLNLQKATPLVRDDKVRPKILRIFKIWEQRSVYGDEFLSDLTGLLSAGTAKKTTDDEASDFQPQQLVNKIKQCTVLENDTDLRLKNIHECGMQLSDPEVLLANIKDRRNMAEAESIEKQLAEGIERVERYTVSLQREIVAREALLALLASAHQYYQQQRGEVKIVAHAYKNFGARVRLLKRKLDEKTPTLPARERTPSPPKPGDIVPSPTPDDDLPLPTGDEEEYNIDKTFSTSLAADGSMYNPGFSSFLSSGSVLDFFQESQSDNTASKIEVINSGVNSASSEKSDFNINDFLKNLSSEPAPNTRTPGAIMSQNSNSLPGLDLLTDNVAPMVPPQLSFYGSLDSSMNDDVEPYEPEAYKPEDYQPEQYQPEPYQPEPYQPETYQPEPYQPEPYKADSQWSNASSWNTAPPPPPSMPPLSPPPPVPRLSYSEPPSSPLSIPTDQRHYTQDMQGDVDHRGLLPPPPPPPILPTIPIVDVADVDHRQMPSLPPPPVPPPLRSNSQQDVDHRNLISLTSHPPSSPRLPLPQQHTVDQDYRVTPSAGPPDIVESVDMELSDDDAQHGESYKGEGRFSFEEGRRNKNYKMAAGRDNGTRNHSQSHSPEQRNNLIRINSDKERQPHSAPIKPMVNPFDREFEQIQEIGVGEDDPFDVDIRTRFPEQNAEGPRFDPRFQRGSFQHRPPPFGQRQPFWPRNGPRPPMLNPWGPPRPRFW